MPLHPQAQEYVAQYPSDLDLDSVDLAAIEQIRAHDEFARHRGPLTRLAFVRDETAEDVPIRVYRADRGDGALPVIVYFHGGGWVFGGVKRNDATGRDLAVRTGAVVVSVEYRLAPEHPFPAAADDAWTVVRDIFARPAFYQCDGGVAAMDTPSYAEFAKGFGLDAEEMAWFYGQYAPHADPGDPRLSPLRLPSLAGLAPATVVTAGSDVLRDDGGRYGARLAEAGVPVETRDFEGAVHGFFGLPGLFDQAVEAREYVAARLREAL